MTPKRRATSFLTWLLLLIDEHDREAVELDQDPLLRKVQAHAIDGQVRIVTDTPSSRTITDYEQKEQN